MIEASNRVLTAARDENAARIAELREKYFQAADLTIRTCLLCGLFCDPLAANPGLWPLHIGNARDAHVSCVNDLIREHRPDLRENVTLAIVPAAVLLTPK